MDNDSKLLTEAYLNKIVGEGFFGNKSKPQYVGTYPNDSRSDKRFFATRDEAEAWKKEKEAKGLFPVIRKISDLAVAEAKHISEFPPHDPEKEEHLLDKAGGAMDIFIEELKRSLQTAGEDTEFVLTVRRKMGRLMIEKIYRDLMGINIDNSIGYKLKGDKSDEPDYLY